MRSGTHILWRLGRLLAPTALVISVAGCDTPWTAPSAADDYPRLIPMDEILAAAEVDPLPPAP
jgi:hypothetical protein